MNQFQRRFPALFGRGHGRQQHITLKPLVWIHCSDRIGGNVPLPDPERAPRRAASRSCVEGFSAVCTVSGMLAEGWSGVVGTQGRARIRM